MQYSGSWNTLYAVNPTFHKRDKGILDISLPSSLGVALCTITAALVSACLQDARDARLAGPVICLQAVIVTLLWCGRVAGIIGTVSACVVLAICLFPPLGSFAIHDPVDGVALTLFGVASVACAALVPFKNLTS
jgi:K+-sensing histidine kinase KdpD